MAPFKTISAAAEVAQPGEVVTVHEGTYRERIDPPRGGTSDEERIVYRAPPDEEVVVKGSEPVDGWEQDDDGVWSRGFSNEFFGARYSFSGGGSRVFDIDIDGTTEFADIDIAAETGGTAIALEKTKTGHTVTDNLLTISTNPSTDQGLIAGIEIQPN